MAESNWATTGKRWLPLSEVLKQTPEGDRVIYVVIYKVTWDGYGGQLHSSLEEAQKSCAMSATRPLIWEERGSVPHLHWKARDGRNTQFVIESLVVNTNPLFKED